MDSNAEWQRQHAQQRIRKHLDEAEQHRLSRQQRMTSQGWSLLSIVHPPLRLVAAFAGRRRVEEVQSTTPRPRTG